MTSSEATADEEWSIAYLKRTVAFRQVKNSNIAIRWINAYSSGHADSLATADYTESRKFISHCRSAAIYINASPQFIRNARQTSEIALGASDHKGIGSGPDWYGSHAGRISVFFTVTRLTNTRLRLKACKKSPTFYAVRLQVN